MKVMFLDESGDHRLKRIDQKYPVFVLGGVIIDRAYLREIVEPAMRAFKLRFFGRDDVILHTVDMSRGTRDYALLSQPNVRRRFYSELNRLLLAWDYVIVACVIRKGEYLARYRTQALDPYVYSLDVLVERFCAELGTDLDSGFICAEKRNPGLDHDLLQAWEGLRTTGSAEASATRIDHRIVGLDLRDKKPNLAGLQLADLVVTPIGRHVLSIMPKVDQVQWSVVERKLCRGGGTYAGHGLVIRP